MLRLLILVDMGSLKAIHRHFDQRAFHAGDDYQQRLDQHGPVCRGVFTGHLLKISPRYRPGCAGQYQLYWPKSSKPRAILTCATGISVATNLCALLSAGIPQALEIDVVAAAIMRAGEQ